MRKAKRLDTGELLLPNGKIAGHKDYLKFYKQRLRFREPEVNPLRQLMSDPSLQKELLKNERALVTKAASLAGTNTVALHQYNAFLGTLKRRADKANTTTYNRLKNDWMKYSSLPNLQTRCPAQQAAEILPRQKHILRIRCSILCIKSCFPIL